jgi:hypothetical protein
MLGFWHTNTELDHIARELLHTIKQRLGLQKIDAIYIFEHNGVPIGASNVRIAEQLELEGLEFLSHHRAH